MTNLIKSLTKLIIAVFLLAPIFSKAQSAEALAAFNAGVKSTNEGKFDEGIISFTEAIRLYSTYAYAYNLRGYCYIEKEAYDKAIIDFKEAIKLNKTYSDAYYNLGRAYHKKKEYPEAITNFNESLKLAKDSSTYNNRGIAYYALEEYDIAISDFKTAIGISPKNSVIIANMASAYVKKKDYENAIKYYKEAITTDRDYVRAYQELGDIYITQKDYENAILCFNNIVRIDPRDFNGYYLRAKVYKSQKNLDAEISEYNRFLKLVPNNFTALDWRADAYYRSKYYDLALADYNEIIKIEPTKPYYYTKRAIVFNELGQKDLALKDYNQVIKLAPTASNYRGRASFYEKLKDNDLALKDFEESIKLEPNNADGYMARADYYQRKRLFDLAMADLDKASLIKPKWYLVSLRKYYIEKDRGNYQEAIVHNEFVIKYTNNSFEANSVPLYMRLGQIEKAIAFTKKIDTTNYYNAEYYNYYFKSIADLPNNQFGEALENIDIGLKLYNKVANDLFHQRKYTDMLALKGYLLEKLDRNSEAKQIYEQALLINPLQGDLKTALENLQKKGNVIASTDKIPPVISLISPVASRGLQVVSTGSKTEIIGKAKDPSGIMSVKINGLPVTKIEEDGLFILTLVLKPGLNNIIISATDKKGNIATKTFPVTGTAATSAVIAQKKEEAIIMPVATGKQPQFHAILIAANDYEDPKIQDLENPVKDAEELAGILKSNYTFDAKNIETLYNKSREEIMQALVAKSSSMTDNDNLIIFYAGHGIAEKDRFGDVDGYWIPSSAKKGLTASYISADDINKALKRSNSKHILVVADACFSGAFTRSLDDASMGIQKQYNVPSRKIMASGNMEPVPDNSKFIYYLKKNLKENTAKYLSAKKLFDSFYEAILNNSNTSPQYAPIKNVGDEGGEFIFIKK